MNVDPILSEVGEVCEEEIIVPSPIIEYGEKRLAKRSREDEGDEEWVEIRNRKARRREVRGIIDICISSTNILPKQFALAKIFRDQGITDISRVKYINPYKIIVEVTNACSMEKLTSCEYLLGLVWRFQRPMEVALSYGVIKHIELNLSEEELLDAITSVYEVASLKRLKRRSEVEGGWTDSEAVILGFKGPSLPAYIHIYSMQVKVEPYMFPVTQCSRCWRFGHTIKMCPTKTVFCPKCGGKHDNCPTTVYKCINCSKDHMALDRSCPEYRREKKIREIMAEFNVSYRKAITMYVPPQLNAKEATLPANQSYPDPRAPTPAPTNHQSPAKSTTEALTYAQVASTRARKTEITNKVKNRNTSDAKKKNKEKEKKQELEANSDEENMMVIDSEETSEISDM
ncbi:uncharacterized protein LOC126779823 [Nymphalis io]|uniref:uncharacterized protein LOC126779823 n=1 Tax=Inachis io TaxID=171585 RepID=UPI002166D5F0|nr:uncharacterized protein LOC126779823 [Nymphalis io]